MQSTKSAMKAWRTAVDSILVVDDQPDVLEALRLLLKGQGFEVETAQSPAAAPPAEPRVLAPPGRGAGPGRRGGAGVRQPGDDGGEGLLGVGHPGGELYRTATDPGRARRGCSS